MKHRNPLFVAGFPYILVFVGYVSLQMFIGVNSDKDGNPKPVSSVGWTILAVALAMLLVGVVYFYYWQISTARGLRKATGMPIPNSILLFIPLANYWWMWKYSEAADRYTNSKIQAILGFLVLALLGAIGNGILQDGFNKASAPDLQAQALAAASQAVPLPPADMPPQNTDQQQPPEHQA